MQDNDSVAMFLQEEPSGKKQSCGKPGRRFFCVLAFVVFLTLSVLSGIVLSISVTNKKNYESLKSQYDGAVNDGQMEYRESNIELRSFIDERINKSEFAWIRRVDARLAAIKNNLRNDVNDDRQLQTHMNKSFVNLTLHVDSLITAVDNLTWSLSRTKSNLHHTLRSLRRALVDVKGDISSSGQAVKEINNSRRNDLTRIMKHMHLTVKDLKHELSVLNSSSETRFEELLEHWNETNTEFEKALDQLSHQNKTIHLNLEYHSKKLSYEVQNFKKKLAQMNKKTLVLGRENKEKFEVELNETRQSLKKTFQNKISQTNTSLSSKIESIETHMKTLLANVKTEIGAVVSSLQTNVTRWSDKQRNASDYLSKTKVKLEKVDRGQGERIAILEDNMKNITHMNVRLKETLNREKNNRLKLEEELRNLRRIVNQLQNNANGILTINNASLVVFLMWSILLHT